MEATRMRPMTRMFLRSRRRSRSTRSSSRSISSSSQDTNRSSSLTLLNALPLLRDIGDRWTRMVLDLCCCSANMPSVKDEPTRCTSHGVKSTGLSTPTAKIFWLTLYRGRTMAVCFGNMLVKVACSCGSLILLHS